MTKKLPLVFSIASAASLVLLTAYQSEVIKELRATLDSTLQRLIKVEINLEEEILKNEALQQEVLVLRDSVNILSLTIDELNAKVGSLQARIGLLNENIQKKADRITALTKELEKLKNNNQGNLSKIKILENERQELLTKLQELDIERIKRLEEKKLKEEKALEQTQEKEKIEERIEQKEEESTAFAPRINQGPGTEPTQNGGIPEKLPEQIRMTQQKRLTNIVTNTNVNFERISLRNKENSNDLKKIKSDGWRYTFIDFSLENPDMNALRDEYFLIQLFDIDNEVVVPLNEYNPAYPDSPQGSNGYVFQYTGKPISVRYVNTQLKQGTNYQVRLYYCKDNKMVIPLRNGIKEIVRNGEVVAK